MRAYDDSRPANVVGVAIYGPPAKARITSKFKLGKPLVELKWLAANGGAGSALVRHLSKSYSIELKSIDEAVRFYGSLGFKRGKGNKYYLP